MATMTDRFARPVAGTFLAYLAGLAANLVVSILVARTMGPAGAGVIALALAGANILALLGNLGLPNAISHFLRKEPISARGTVGAALPIALSAGALLMVLYMRLCPQLQGWLRAAAASPAAGTGVAALTPSLMMLAAWIVPLEIILQCAMAGFQGRQEFGLRVSVLLAYRWLYAVLAVVLVLAVGATPKTIIAAGIAAYVLTCAAGTGVLFRRLGPAPEPSYRWPDSRRLLGFAVRTHVSAVLVFVILRLDLFFVRALLGDDAQVGLYSRAVQVAEVVLYFMLALETVVYPRMSGLAAPEVPRAAAVMCRRGLLAGAALVVVFELASRWLILIPFGREFAGSIAPLRILLPGVLAIGLARALFSVFNALERPLVPAVIAAAGLALIVALDLVWIPRYGIEGAALASLVAYGLMAAAALVWFTRSRGGRLVDFLLPRREDLTSLRSARSLAGHGCFDSSTEWGPRHKENRGT